MSQIHGLMCSNSGCTAKVIWLTARGVKAPTKAGMEAAARRQGWNAPDRLGNHWCPACRRPDGRRKR